MNLVACAVIREDPPEVYVAEDMDTLNWVLALKVVARTGGSQLSPGVRDNLRSALLEERWGDAVEQWIDHSQVAVDVYPSMELYGHSDVAMAPIEMQFLALFED
jgi:hypothetical protein